MLFSFSFKSSILLIFFFHGVVFSTLLLLKGIQTENKSSYWLSAFTLLCSLYIAPFMLGYAGWYSTQPYRDFLFYTPFQQLFLLPPVLYFYTKTLLDKSFKFSKIDYTHFLPAIIYLAYSLIIFIIDKIFLHEYYFYKDEKDKDFSNWYQIAGFISLVFYLTKSLKIYLRYKHITYNTLSYADMVMFVWARRFLISFLILITIRTLFFVINPEWDEFGRKFWYYLSFSFLFYFVSISGYTNSIMSVISFKDPEIDFTRESDSNIVEEKNEMPDIDLWKEKIENLMVLKRIYENPELNISDISKELCTHPKRISHVINQGFNMNFNDYVNEHRVKALIRKVEEREHDHKTLLGLAFECGFNSKSTFNRVFKKLTSITPKEYIEKNYLK